MSRLTIYCPKCGAVALHTDDAYKTPLSAKCRRCKKLVKYNAETGKVELDNIPSRKGSSGTRLW